ncbi:DNA/RNA helicase domain-containing protein [Embleya sp. NPDC020886]|uniref:DNA/RNA helicase domain-containing protein n=1 Tax=Embleya sp. NPDC020886 TaxID=3363980 RepID=UPI003787BDAD
MITVHGGPGSGKTALAVRLLAHLMRRPDAALRYVTPSGTLRAHLCDAADNRAANDLFLPASRLRTASRRAGVLIVDEAQRLDRPGGAFPPDLTAAIRETPLVIVFLDERQIIRPREGVTVAEIAAATATSASRTTSPMDERTGQGTDRRIAAGPVRGHTDVPGEHCGQRERVAARRRGLPYGTRTGLASG